MRELRAALALAAALLIGLPGAASAHSGDATSVWPQLEPAFSAVEGGQALVAADDVSNGSFERPVIPDGAGYQSHEGTGIEDWHVDGRVDLASSELWAAAEGRQSVDLNELAPGGVWQDVATQVDADYDLTFSLAVNVDPTCVGADIREMTVLWNGAEVARPQVASAGRTPEDPGWQDRKVRVHATGATSRLEFKSLTEGACGPAIDFVRLEPPEVVPPKLTILRTGNGHGTVETVADASIACGDTCEASYDPGTVVELRAVPDEGSRFIGWRRACTGQDCAPTVNADTTVEAVFAGAGPLTWSLARDYRVSFDGPEANPITDASAVSEVWRLGYSDAGADLDAVRHPPAYHAFEQRGTAGDVLSWGHAGWDASFAMGDTPAASQYPHAVVVTPPADRVLVTSWTSPITGHVRISGGITDTDGSAGDGVRWFVTKGADELARGAIANGGCETQGFLDGTGGDSLADVPVAAGTTLHFVIDPRAGAIGDATALDVNIAEIDPDTAGPPVRDRWEIASDFRWDPILQNPNFDAYGYVCAWSFEQRTGDPAVVSKLTNTTNELTGLPLLNAWTGDVPGAYGALHPLVAMNTGTEVIHLNFPVPSRTFLMHPAADGTPAILRWRSPFRGHVKVTGAATHLDHNGGDGVTWAIEHGADTLDQGTAFQGRSAFDDPALEARAVEKGDVLRFVVGPSGGYDYDTTQLDVVIERVQATPQRTLSVIRNPEEGGQVESGDAPKTINCGATCQASYPDGAEVTLTAAPKPGWDFARWEGGGCSGDAPCTVEMTAPRTVTAVFEREKHPLTVEVRSVQEGAGLVESADGRISCSPQCEAVYDHGDVVILRHHAAAGSRFTGWTGCGLLPGGPAGDCVVTIDAAKTVIASFVKRVRLNLLVEGSGRVTATPGFVDCAAACEADYDRGTTVTLDARPQAGWEFAGWEGVACTEPLGCSAPMDADRHVTARFRRTNPPQTLVVEVMPRGGGTVTSDLQPIDGTVTSDLHTIGGCATVCSTTVPYGTVVNLHARALPGYRFKRMSSSSCSDPKLPPDCRLEMTAGRAVTVEFERLPGGPYTLSLGVSGQKGSVLVTPPGTRCLSSTITWSTNFCKYQVPEGTTVVLEAQPDAGHRFVDWKLGPCQYRRKPGTKEPQPRCEFVMTAALVLKGSTGLNVDAAFEPLKLPKPAVGQTAISKPLAGVVTYQPPAVAVAAAAAAAPVSDVPFVRMDGRQVLPVGSVIDATRGALRVTVRNGRGKLQAIDAAGGMFAFRQVRRGSMRGRTTLELTTAGPNPCADRKRLVQTLRASSAGPLFVRTRFAEARTRSGRFTTEDRCDRTVTKVAKGTVVVRPLRGKRGVRVRPGRRASTR